MTELIERIRQVIADHRANDSGNDAKIACGCGQSRLPDHSRHVAEEIVRRLGLRPEQVSDAEKRLRYVSALFDDELTKLEGAE
jgi:hypothetical protein